MSDHDSPIQINSGGGTLAQQIVSSEQSHWSVPDGAILASGVRRTASFTVDVVIVTTILMIVTGGRIIVLGTSHCGPPRISTTLSLRPSWS